MTIEKIYLIHQLDMCDQAGGVLHVIGLAKGLSRLRDKIVVVAPKVEVSQGAFLFLVQYLRVLSRPRVVRLLSYEIALAGYLLGQKAVWTRHAAIYVRRGTLLLTPFLIAKIFRLASAVEENGLDWALELGQLKGIQRWWHILLRRIQGVVYRLAGVVIVPTAGMKFHMGKFSSKIVRKTFVVPNGVELDVFRVRELKEARECLGLPLQMRYVCFVGHFYPGRGLGILIEALPKIVQRVPDALLLLVGDGPLRKTLEEKVRQLDLEEYALFMGFQPPTKAALYIAASEVCLAPYDTLYASLTSLSPLKLYSYMACARPVVISDIPIECEGLVNAARIVSPEQPDALAEAVVDLLNHPEEARRMGERGREIVEELYTWDIAAKKVLAVLNWDADNCCEN